MTSKLVVNTIEADTGISSVSFGSSISLSSTSKFFFGAAGIDIGADTNINRPASGVLGFNINGSEKARIDSSGRIGVGVVPTAQFAHNLIQIGHQATLGANAALSTTGQTFLTHNLYFDTGGTLKVFNTSNANEGAIFRLVDGQLLFSNSTATTGTPTVVERLRIASDGRVTTSTSGLISHDFGTTSSTGAYLHFDLGANGANIGYMGPGNHLVTGAAVSDLAIRSGANLVFSTSGATERVRIASDGDMGVGTNSPSARLHVNGGDGLLVERSAGTSIAGFKHSGASAMNIYFQNTGSTNHPYIGSSNQDLTLGTNNSERLRIDSAGRFLKGLTGSGASRSSTSVRYPHFQLSSPWSSGLGSYKIECTDDYPIIFIDSNASYANGSGAGVITWSVKDGSGDYCNTASVRSLIDGTPSNDNAPGRLEFMTTTSGTSPTTKMTISSEGHITKPNQPSCMAYNAQGQHMSGGAIAQFNSTRFNIGGHYNSSNGRFTAPVAGRYLVAYSGLHDYQGQATTGFTIRLNGSDFNGGEAYDQVYGSSNSHQCQLAKTLILNMSANDYVQIYIRSSGTQVHQRYGSFSVCLLT